MNDGLRILIDRMMEFPQDFEMDAGQIHGYGALAWGRLLDAAKSMANRANVFTEEEKAALAEAENEMMRRLFTAKVMEALVPAPPREEKVENSKYAYANNGTATLTASSAIMPARTLQIGSAGLTEDDIHAIKKQLGR